MHYSIDCYVANTLPVKYQITPFMAFRTERLNSGNQRHRVWKRWGKGGNTSETDYWRRSGGSRGGSMGSIEPLFWRAAFRNTMPKPSMYLHYTHTGATHFSFNSSVCQLPNSWYRSWHTLLLKLKCTAPVWVQCRFSAHAGDETKLRLDSALALRK